MDETVDETAALSEISAPDVLDCGSDIACFHVVANGTAAAPVYAHLQTVAPDTGQPALKELVERNLERFKASAGGNIRDKVLRIAPIIVRAPQSLYWGNRESDPAQTDCVPWCRGRIR